MVCGNYSSPKEGEQNENSASGADSACVSSLLNVAMHRNWTAGSVDIKAAFLQAPRRNSSKRLTICDPPSVLKAMNLVAPSEKWIIKQALYGLVESPADWGAHRDEVLRGFTWYEDGAEFALVETAERHVWRVTQRNDPKAEHGYLLTYVDDMLVVGPKGKIQKVVELIQGRWECSQPEFLSTEKSMKFCGYDLKLVNDGLKISQEGYTRDLVARYGITSAEAFPLPKIEESEGPEEFSIAELRRAQSIVGEILWLSTKSRPDVAFATGALGRMVHQRPNCAFGLGLHVLKYLYGTLEYGLFYKGCAQGDLGASDHLQLPRSTSRIDIYADISYSPSHEGYRSVQGIIAEHGGNVILWESGRQPFICHSTAESELVSYSESHQVGEALSGLLSVMGFSVDRLLYGDNKAALSAATMETGSWRTRHLRLRAHALRNALATPESRWAARHMPGRHLIADGLTKPLQGAAFMNFVDKLGLSNGGEKPKICRVAAGTCFGETLWSRVVLCSVALLGMNQLVLAAIVLAAGLLWKEGTRPIRAEEPRPHKSLRKLWMEGQNPPREEDEVAHPPSNRKGTVFLGDSWSHEDEEGKGVGSGLRAFEQAQDDEGCSSSHGHGAMSFGASCCDGIFGGQPCIRAFRGPPGRGSGAAERGKAATQRSEKKDLGRTPAAVHLQVDALAEDLDVHLTVTKKGEREKPQAAAQSSHVEAGLQSAPEEQSLGSSGSDDPDEQSVHVNRADQSSQLHQGSGYGPNTAAHEAESGGDSVAAGPWCLSHFAKPKSGSKDWWDMSFQAQGWAIRVHATWRIRPFHPVHRLTPVNTARLATERTTLRFDDAPSPVISTDDWQDPSCARGTATQRWKGFTFFRFKPDPEDPNDGFELIDN